MGTTYNPNAPCGDNGNYFGFPYKWQNSPLVLVSVPWDVTTSYAAGAARGPESIRRASTQLDFFDFEVPLAHLAGGATYPFEESAQIEDLSKKTRPAAEKIIAFQEGILSAKSYNAATRTKDLARIENACRYTNVWLQTICQNLLSIGKTVGVVGGDHSSPFGLMQALAAKHNHFGILHLDAHADLRKGYEGFTYSHASIMYNALQITAPDGTPAVKRLVQTAIRDVCQDEMDYAASQAGRVVQFPDIEIQKQLFEGKTWAAVCKEIIDALPQKVYISFDIDALEPSLCPHTGTPVPGGLSFAQARYLLSALRKSKKQIIGFDLCETAPDSAHPQNEWDGNVGARVLFMLCLAIGERVSDPFN